MLPYVLSYAFYWLMLAFSAAQQRNLYVWWAIGLLPMLSLVLLRGTVGVDIPMYVAMIQTIKEEGGLIHNFEPGFEVLILLLSRFLSEPFHVTLFISFITSLLFAVPVNGKVGLAFLALCIIPYFYFDMTMNGLRYGLAFGIIYQGARFLLAGNLIAYIGFVMLACCFQLSSVLVGALLYFLCDFSWRKIGLVVVSLCLCAVLAKDYIWFKISANMELASPSLFSGVVPLSISLFILMSACLESSVLTKFWRQISILFMLSLLFFLVAKLTYAGLRLQQLNLFLIFVFWSLSLDANKPIPKFLLWATVVVGVMACASRLLTFYSESGVGEAPFAPYVLGGWGN